MSATTTGSSREWRTTASNPGPATRGREQVSEPDPAGQAARDRIWQERMHVERLAHGGKYLKISQNISKHL
eukprot:SAG31_NODE_40251_length_282_cov_0.557377_1_plen_70_part_10